MLNHISKRFYAFGSKAMKSKMAMVAQRSMSRQLQKTDNDYSITPTDDLKQFSKAPIMENFGELQYGEIPEPLKYVRPFHQTTLANGIRVCTEPFNSPLAAVGVFIDAGSRQETLDTNGVAFMLERLLLRGTGSRTGTEILSEIENMGAQYEGKTHREITSHTLKVFKTDVSKAVEILGDMVTNPLLNENAFEAEREVVSQIHENNITEFERTTLQAAHANAFREHMIGCPTRGDRDNLTNLTIDQVREFHSTNYTGKNIVVVVSGGVNHQDVVDMVERNFSSLAQGNNENRNNKEKPIYVPALQMMRDDEMYNSNVAVFYDAPGYKDPDYYSFQVLKRIFGTFRLDKNAEHLNDVAKQYNALHGMIGDLPDVTIHNSHYFAYSDCGIFGQYFFGNEIFTRQMNYCGMVLNTVYGHYMNDVEVFRARNKYYNELLSTEGVLDTIHDIAPQILYLGRRVPRSEIAKRIAFLDAYHMKNLCYDWFYDAEPSITNWGPIEGTSSIGSYKYYKNHTYSTVSNAHHGLYS
jgi:processing peptidase subunit beta